MEDNHELIDLIKRLPEELAPKKQKHKMLAILAIDQVLVENLMTKYSEVNFIKEDDILGPLVLDKLYKSGFTVFPIITKDGRIKGTVSTKALNNLEIREEVLASSLTIKKPFFVRNDYSIKEFLSTVVRSGEHYFIVCDKYKRTVGVINLETVLSWLVWSDLEENFSDDDRVEAVARRYLKISKT